MQISSLQHSYILLGWCMIHFYMYQLHVPILCLIGWGVITWPLGWSDPSIGCAWSISLLPCFLHVYPNMFNIKFFFAHINFSLGCLDLCWIVLAYMSSLQATETCGLIQPSTIIPFEMCSYVVLRNMTIFLIVVTTFPCIVVPIVVVCIVVSPCWLIGCLHRLWSTLKSSMCPHEFVPAILC